MCEKQFIDVKKDNDETFDTCETVVAATKQPTIRRTQGPGPSITHPSVFKPQTDLKPNFLIKDCTLLEYNKFTETFITYINSSGSVVPEEAIFSNLRVHMDPYWFTELKGKGLHIRTTLPEFQRLMDEVSLMKFPKHNRRVTVFRGRPVISKRNN